MVMGMLCISWRCPRAKTPEAQPGSAAEAEDDRILMPITTQKKIDVQSFTELSSSKKFAGWWLPSLQDSCLGLSACQTALVGHAYFGPQVYLSSRCYEFGFCASPPAARLNLNCMIKAGVEKHQADRGVPLKMRAFAKVKMFLHATFGACLMKNATERLAVQSRYVSCLKSV